MRPDFKELNERAESLIRFDEMLQIMFSQTQQLKDAGIPAALIGSMTEGNDRILRNGEEIRYLDRPKPDELYRVKR